MKILFLEVDTETSWGLASVGPSFLGALLRDAGHEVTLLRARLDMDTPAVVAAVRAAAPDLLGLSLTTRQWLRARDLVAAIRATLDVPVVAGGLHPTFAPEQVLEALPPGRGFDVVCLGEGEGPMADLVAALEAGETPATLRLRRIANLWVRGGLRPELRAPIEPLDALPLQARDLLDEPQGVAYLSTQRGCPFPCTYCAARMYDEMYDQAKGRYAAPGAVGPGPREQGSGEPASGGDYGRRRTPDHVIAEIRHLRDTRGVGYIIFLDDTFTIHHKWVREFCDRYQRELGLPFSLNARVETVNPELLATLARAGCRHIIYGVESGSERVRREIMKRPVRNDRFREVFRWTRDAGITVTANYMIGLPGETRADLDDTLALAEELDAYDFGYFVFYPYPGTPLFQVCRDEGYLPEDYLERPANHRASILKLPDLSPDDIAEYYDRFTALRERLYLRRLTAAHPEAEAPGEVEPGPVAPDAAQLDLVREATLRETAEREARLAEGAATIRAMVQGHAHTA